MPAYPLINGNKWDFASVEIDVSGAGVYVGVKELKWSQKLTPGVLRGTRPEKLGRTLGEYDAEGNMTLYAEDWRELQAALGNGYMANSFNITCTYQNDGVPGTFVSRLVGCRITSVGGGGSQGTDPLETALDLNIMYVEENGLKAIPNQLM